MTKPRAYLKTNISHDRDKVTGEKLEDSIFYSFDLVVEKEGQLEDGTTEKRHIAFFTTPTKCTDKRTVQRHREYICEALGIREDV